MQTFDLPTTDGPVIQVVSPAAGAPRQPANGLFRLVLAVPGSVSAGTVLIEYLLRGSGVWRRAPNGLRNLTDRDIVAFAQGEIESFRFTFAGVVGASSIVGIMYQEPTIGFLPHHFTNNNGDFARLRVDVAETGFFAGREFRTFKEFVNQTLPYVIKVTVGINTILHSLTLQLESGGVRLSSWAGGTDGGTFGETLPVTRKNRMTDAPTPGPLNSMVAGGTYANDGINFDIVRLVASNQSGTVDVVGGAGNDSERGVSPGTYYFVFESIAGTATGTFHAHWEERHTNGS